MEVMVLYLEFILTTSISITDLIKWSYFAVGEACSLFKADDNSVDCVNVHDLLRQYEKRLD